ncbi:MAG TPA: 1-phosphofructokinase family hexose kinase [Candidatus Hydrogenedentes bacterium]|nr:1-phosphofructokinase family hexose kinase [Candidatus Hydrogenedentota bacterium]HPG67639.1 1-phosphofructokinase family hexose kinase [Candidatus Hydrogenedentota bacterium]
MILTVTPNPCVDKTVFIDHLEVGTFMRANKCTCVPGGKGANASRAVKVLGRATTAMVIVGGHPGTHVVDMIREQDGVDCAPVWVASPTRTITTVLEEPMHRQTAFFEPGSRVTLAEADQLVDQFVERVAGASVVTFNGTVPDPAIEDLYQRLIPIARAAGVTTILDAHGPEFALGLEAVPYMVKPNVAETEELVGFRLDTDEAKWRAVDFFHERGVELVALSLGKAGALVSRGSERLHVTPPAIREVNPVGSGDALVAGFAIGLLEGMRLDEMARLGVAAGTANAMSWDIGHFSVEEVVAVADKVEIRPL